MCPVSILPAESQGVVGPIRQLCDAGPADVLFSYVRERRVSNRLLVELGALLPLSSSERTDGNTG